MKLTDAAWDEWLTSPITDRVSASSEISGLVSAMDTSVRDRRVKLGTNRFWVFRRLRRLWPKSLWVRQVHLRELLFVGQNEVALLLPTSLYRSILDLSEGEVFFPWAWARGVWGVCGAVYAPKIGYYCHLRIKQPQLTSTFASLLERHEINFSVRRKRGAQEIILRDLASIQELLHLLKLPEQVNLLEESYMARSLRDLANRQVNCDDANIMRTVKASREQLQLVEFAIEHLELNSELQELVTLRQNNPDASLAELGAMMSPSKSKSTVQYRFKKLLSLACARGYDLSIQALSTEEDSHEQDTSCN